MFTGARLVGGLVLGLSGAVVAMLIVDGDPSIRHLRVELIYMMAAVGFLTGWRSLGKQVGAGYKAAFGFGLRAAVAMALWSILVAALFEVFRNVTENAGQGFMFPVYQTFGYVVDISLYMLKPAIIATALVLGVICAMVTEYASRIWP